MTLLTSFTLLLSLLSLVYSQVVTIFSTPACPAGKQKEECYKAPGVLYARTLLTSDGAILATWENYGPEPPCFPIFKSVDKGLTWKEIARVEDTENGWGLRYQPFLYELPQELGGFPAGTILLAGSSIPKDLSVTRLELYASVDKA